MRSFTAIFMFAAVMLAAQVWAAESAEIFDVRFGVKGDDKTRIVLDLTKSAKYRADVRIDDQGKRFLAVDLAMTSFNIGNNNTASGAGRGIGHMGNYAWSTTIAGRGQLLFQINETAIPSSVFLLKPKGKTSHYRLVIDMASASELAFTETIGKKFGSLGRVKKPEMSVRATKLGDGREAPFGIVGNTTREIAIAAAKNAIVALPDARLDARIADSVPIPKVKPSLVSILDDGRPMVVIDPGHGGKHPGSVGQSGLVEKNVTLAAAKTLKAMLIKRGYKVMLTREADKYVDLPDRMEFARAQKAELFLSIHADGNKEDTIRGASVYTLSDKGSDRLTNQTKATGDFQLIDFDVSTVDNSVGQIIFDMSAKKAREQSAVFSSILIKKLNGKIEMLNNTHRQANYKVLLSPDVPAVLLELAFVSNAKDEENLKSKPWRTRAMKAVADGIDEYFADRKPEKHAMNGAGAQ